MADRLQGAALGRLAFAERMDAGARQRQPGFEVPIYRTPPDLIRCTRADGGTGRGRIDQTGRCVLYFTRADIESFLTQSTGGNGATAPAGVPASEDYQQLLQPQANPDPFIAELDKPKRVLTASMFVAIKVVCAAASWFFYTVLARPHHILRDMPWE